MLDFPSAVGKSSLQDMSVLTGHRYVLSLALTLFCLRKGTGYVRPASQMQCIAVVVVQVNLWYHLGLVWMVRTVFYSCSTCTLATPHMQGA